MPLWFAITPAVFLTGSLIFITHLASEKVPQFMNHKILCKMSNTLEATQLFRFFSLATYQCAEQLDHFNYFQSLFLSTTISEPGNLHPFGHMITHS